MKRENLKKEYEIRKMNQKEIEKYLEENQNHKIFKFEDDEKSFMIRENKKSLFIIELIEEKEKKERNHLDRDIKIDSKKINDFGIKLIYHRKKDSEKEFRIFISYKDNDRLIRKRLRNEEIDKISSDEKKMKEYYDKISEKEIKKNLKIS